MSKSAMKSVPRRRGTARVVIVVVATILAAGLAVCAATARAHLVSAGAVDTAGRLENEVITIHPEGFVPAEIKRPAGPFLLSVYNRSGASDATFRVESSSGTSVYDVQLPPNELDWDRVVDLPPDTYTVTETTRGWTCSVTVTE